MIIRPYVLPNGGLNGVAGIALRPDSIVFPDGSTLSLSSCGDQQSLINRAVRGIIPEKLYVAHDIEQQSILFVEENDEAVVLGPKGEKKHDVYALSDQFFLKIAMPRLNLLTQEKDKGDVYLNLKATEENIHVQIFQPDLGALVFAGSIDAPIPPLICSGWYVYGTEFTYNISPAPGQVRETKTYAPSPAIHQAGDLFFWGSEYFTIQEGKIVRETHGEQPHGPFYSSHLVCTVMTDCDNVMYSII